MDTSTSNGQNNTTLPKVNHEEQQQACSLWNRLSWEDKESTQPLGYENEQELNGICNILHGFEPLVQPDEIEHARALYADVARGNSFIIQGGDCAENFDSVSFENTAGHVDLLSEQSKMLSVALDGKPVVRVGRIAGQYAKPRSSPHEKLSSGEVVSSFRGHNINSDDPRARTPDPRRLLMGYLYSAMTLDFISGITNSSESGDEADAGVTAQAHDSTNGHSETPTFLTSHEAFCLPLEAALTHGQYNTSAAFVWVGERTRNLDSAHVEYIRGIRNPIGIKIGPKTTPDELVDLLDTISPNPDNKSWGRVTIITRLGADKVAEVLPLLIEAVQKTNHKPVWMCDPCHGNTESVLEGTKIRREAKILLEVQETYKIHQSLQNHLGGLHLEQTWEYVTECLDADRVSEEADAPKCYTTLCDPRLAKDQALRVVSQFAKTISSSN